MAVVFISRMHSMESVCVLSSSPTSVFIAVDVESRGDDPGRNGCLSVGVCIGRTDRNEVLHKERFDIAPFEGQVFQQRCVDEFWCHHDDKLKVMQNGAKDPVEQISAFRELIDRYNDGVQWKAMFVSDTSGFDYEFINYYLGKAGLHSMRYDKQGLKYQKLHSLVEFARGVARVPFGARSFGKREIVETFQLDVDLESHDHMPENDANVIYDVCVALHLQLQAGDGPAQKKAKVADQ